jgi:hypothetical protein
VEQIFALKALEWLHQWEKVSGRDSVELFDVDKIISLEAFDGNSCRTINVFDSSSLSAWDVIVVISSDNFLSAIESLTV